MSLWDKEEELKKKIGASAFISSIMVGPCPKCGRKNTTDCEDVEGIEDITIGICWDCKNNWCLECGSLLEWPEHGSPICEHWALCESCPERHIFTCEDCKKLGIYNIDPNCDECIFTEDKDIFKKDERYVCPFEHKREECPRIQQMKKKIRVVLIKDEFICGDNYMQGMSEIVKFTLEKYGIKARWRIIPLNKDKWIRLSADKCIMDNLAWTLEKKIKNLMEKNKAYLEENTDFKNKLSELFKMEKEIEKEYGKASTLISNLSSVAMTLLMKPYKRIFRNKKMRKDLPFYYKLFKKNKARDFLILLNVALTSELNKSLTSEDSKREKLKTLVHEAIHYIQNVSGTRTDFESIEKEADRIVDEFQISREKKMIEKHGNADQREG